VWRIGDGDRGKRSDGTMGCDWSYNRQTDKFSLWDGRPEIKMILDGTEIEEMVRVRRLEVSPLAVLFNRNKANEVGD